MSTNEESEETRATISNMQLCEAARLDGVIAYSPGTGEESSGTAADYWHLPADYCLTDEDGNEMILVRRVTRYEGVASLLPAVQA